MKSGLRRRFYPESILGVISLVMFLVTLARRDWIETLFKIDPDQGNGSVEWVIVGVLLAVTLVLISLARYEWRRASTAAA